MGKTISMEDYLASSKMVEAFCGEGHDIEEFIKGRPEDYHVQLECGETYSPVKLWNIVDSIFMNG
jgi:hypothetical protein